MDDAPLVAALRDAQRLGHLGPQDVAVHVEQSRRFLAVCRDARDAVDVGTGGGVPGLCLAWWMPETRWRFVELRQRRADDLRRLVGRLRLDDRVTVICDDVRRVALASPASADLVTARCVGAAIELARLAAPLLQPGGRLVVSRPDAATPDRALWSDAGLDVIEVPDGLVVARRSAGST